MWPFKKKNPPACMHCEYEQHTPGSSCYCNKSVKTETEYNLITGRTITTKTDAQRCRDERNEHPWFVFWHCGKRGRFFKDKRKFS